MTTKQEPSLNLYRLTAAGEEIELPLNDLAEDELRLFGRLFPGQVGAFVRERARAAKKLAIKGALEARHLNHEEVKIWLTHDGECVVDRLPDALRFNGAVFGQPHRRYVIFLTSNLELALFGDIEERPEAWGGANATTQELQAAVERFLEDFVEPADHHGPAWKFTHEIFALGHKG